MLAAERSLVTVEEIVDELDPRPNAVVLPIVGRHRRGRGAGRRPPLLRPRLLRARQRRLQGVGRASAATATGSASGSRRCERHRAATWTTDEMMSIAAVARARGRHVVLRRHRAAEHRREPRPAHARARRSCSSTRPARSAPSRPAAALDRRRHPRRDRRRRGHACPRSSTTGCSRGGSTSASSARRRSTASRTSTRPSSGPTTTHPKVRLPGAGGAPEIAAGCGEVIVIVRQSTRSFVEQVDFVTSVGHGRGPGDRERLGLRGRGPVRVITDLGVLEPRSRLARARR